VIAGLRVGRSASRTLKSRIAVIEPGNTLRLRSGASVISHLPHVSFPMEFAGASYDYEVSDFVEALLMRSRSVG